MANGYHPGMQKLSDPEHFSILPWQRHIVYIAVPYSHPDLAVRSYRVECANKLAAMYIEEGEAVYSPLSMWHAVAQGNKLPTGFNYWGKVDKILLRYTKLLSVLKIEGWNESRGVRAEVELAKELKIPITYIPKDMVCSKD